MDLKSINKQSELWDVINWLAQPTVDRNPKTQKELAEKLEVDESSIITWKKVEGFWEEVKKIRMLWIKDKVSDVLTGLYRKALKGDASEVKLFLQYAGEFIEEIKISKEEYSPETVKKVMETLKNEGFIITAGDNTGQGKEEDSDKE